MIDYEGLRLLTIDFKAWVISAVGTKSRLGLSIFNLLFTMKLLCSALSGPEGSIYALAMLIAKSCSKLEGTLDRLAPPNLEF